MPTIHLALDVINSDFPLSGGNGKIAGMALSVQALRDNGFVSGTYTGNRLVSIDTGDAGWDDECQPGWYFTNSSVQIALPLTTAQENLETLKDAFRNLHTQLHAWADGLDALSRGQPQSLVNKGHDFLFYAHQAAFLIGRDSTTYSQAQRIAWANSMATGAADVQSPAQFYQRITPSSVNSPTGPITWVRAADAVKVNLSNAITVTGTVNVETDLVNGGWIETLTA